MAPLFILTETSAGYVLLKATDKKLLKNGDIAAKTSSAQDTCSLLKLKQFRKFESATIALNEAAAVGEGQVTPLLSSLLDSLKEERKASLAVADPKLGSAIAKIPNLSVQPIADSSTADLFRAIREHLPSLIPGLKPDDLSTMSLGLSHSLSRHKLKFSADKVDTMIIQAISLLDDIDKELNQYAMRVKEWFGWHFPEMARIINDNLAYSRVIMKMGMRSNAVDTDLTEILPEEIAKAVKNAAEVSMGTEISSEDLENIQALADQVISFSEFRTQLSSYLSNRMQAIAPNLTALVGELVGARLIAHAGSLSNLAKSPASTIQILGAEKALFRALKTKHDTPKYGLIYHASLIGQATGRNKGKIARVLAAKAALGLRVDSLGSGGADQERDGPEPTEEERAAIGNRARRYVEHKVRVLEGRSTVPRNAGIGPIGPLAPEQGKWEIKEARKYNPQADGLSSNAEAAGVQVTNGHNPVLTAPAVDSDSESEDEGNAAAALGNANGLSEKEAKKIHKAEKAARKAARAEKRALKAEKKAKKEGRKAAKPEAEVRDAAVDGKKRKRDEDTEEKGEKRKKNKSKS